MNLSTRLCGTLWAVLAGLTLCGAAAQAQILDWTQQLGTSEKDVSHGVSVDGLGNVYIAGATQGILGGTSAGGWDAFISKFNASGAIEWTRQLGTSSTDVSLGVSADGLGNVYISGAMGDGAFVSKYSGNGTREWLETLNTVLAEQSEAVSADGLGNVYVSGNTQGDLGGPHAGGTWDAFVSKYNAAGTQQWTRQLGTSSRDLNNDISADGLGSVYITGSTEGDLDGVNAGGRDAFLSKYNSDGMLAWSRQLGTDRDDGGRGVSADGLGNVYVTGVTEGSLGGSNAGSGDAFLAKYDDGGTLEWTRQLGSNGIDEGNSVSADTFGNVYVTGWTNGRLDGPNAGDIDVFVSKFDANGALNWTRQFGTSGWDDAEGVSTDAFGHIYVSGFTRGGLMGTNAGDFDAFVARYTVVPEPGTAVITIAMILGFAAVPQRRRYSLFASQASPLLKQTSEHERTMTASHVWHKSLFVLIALVSELAFVSVAEAKKPDNPGGGPGGDNPEFELVLLHPDGDWSSARSINDAGIVVGRADGVAGYWDANAASPTFIPLPAAGMDVAVSAYDINEENEIVGQGPSGPLYWAGLNATPIVLPVPVGFQPNPKAISRDGVIVGELSGASGSFAAAWRVTDGSVSGPVFIADHGVANDVASVGDGTNRIVGQAEDVNGTPVAMAWDLDLLTDGLLAVTGSTTLVPGQLSWATAITETGDITGKIVDAPGQPINRRDTAFVIRDGGLVLLPRGKQNDYANGMDLNDTDVVGVAGPNWSAASPVRWNSRNQLKDLTTDYFGEDWLYNSPYGLNSQGNLVGFGKFGNSDSAAWLLRHPLPSSVSATTIPEPSALILVLFGLAGAVCSRRRSRH